MSTSKDIKQLLQFGDVMEHRLLLLTVWYSGTAWIIDAASYSLVQWHSMDHRLLLLTDW